MSDNPKKKRRKKFVEVTISTHDIAEAEILAIALVRQGGVALLPRAFLRLHERCLELAEERDKLAEHIPIALRQVEQLQVRVIELEAKRPPQPEPERSP